MGRRAKKAPVQTKKRPTLAKRFKCPFCSNEDVVECKMDHKARVGSLSCRLCGASFAMPINHLHEPVDVFSEWLDDCEATALGKPTGQAAAVAAAQEAHNHRLEYDISDDDDDDIGQPSGLSAPSKSKGKNGGAASASNTNIADLGLDDSDDDSD